MNDCEVCRHLRSVKRKYPTISFDLDRNLRKPRNNGVQLTETILLNGIDLSDPTFPTIAPSVDCLCQFVPLFRKNIKGKVINFDLKAFVQHLCAPPYYPPRLC